MTLAAAFSPDYVAARARFRASSLALRCGLSEHPIGAGADGGALVGPDGDELTVDVAWLGTEHPRRAVVVSSGLHGVEGYFGSAVQAALLEERLGGYAPPEGTALILIHALNPYGFAWTRRVNEDNVDLNRNFMPPGAAWDGCPDGYPLLDAFLNPERPPFRFPPFLPQAALLIARHGMRALKDTIPVGQYAYPKGLFYGGSGPSRTMELLSGLLADWFSDAAHVLHVDFHTGMGPWGTYKLAANCQGTDPRADWLRGVFGADRVEAWDPAATLYTVHGALGDWCRAALPHCVYDEVTAEFGTYNVVHVLRALRDENQAHHWGEPDDPRTHRAKAALKETFAPGDPNWRASVVRQGLDVVQRALEAELAG